MIYLNHQKKWAKIEFVVFCRSNIKNKIWILQDIPRARVKYLARVRAPTLPNEAQKFSWYAHLCSFRAYQLNLCASFGRVGARARAKYFTCVLGMSWSIQTSFFMLLRQKTTNSILAHFFDDLSKSLNS